MRYKVDPAGVARLGTDGKRSAAGLSKADIDKLTLNGAKLEAVVATHPYHTIYFEPFRAQYPNAK